jgi:hypothetical protein
MNRAGALQYALKFWNRPCHDGVLCTTPDTPWINVHSPRKLRNPRFAMVQGRETIVHDLRDGGVGFIDIAKGADCAHFISCCLGRHGGGLNIHPDVEGVEGKTEAGGLLKWLLTRGGGKALTDKAPFADAQKAVPQLAPADVIIYHDGAKYEHSTLHLGGGKIACHTLARWMQPWELNTAKWTYTLVKMPGPAPSAGTPALPAVGFGTDFFSTASDDPGRVR